MLRSSPGVDPGLWSVTNAVDRERDDFVVGAGYLVHPRVISVLATSSIRA